MQLPGGSSTLSAVFARPDGLSDAAVVGALRENWVLDVATVDYLPVGFGSHHWSATDVNAERWFVTVHDLAAKRHSPTESIAAVFNRLRASLATARTLCDSGATFVLAPVPAAGGEVVIPLAPAFAIHVYPHIDGRVTVGDYRSTAERLTVLDLVAALHTSPSSTRHHAMVDDFELPRLPELRAALQLVDQPWDTGPYAESSRALLRQNASGLERLLDHYAHLVAPVRALADRFVLTHGEPHSENVLVTSSGPMLIDWDTALISPPERDLWMIDSDDGSVRERYAEITGTPVLQQALELYRLRWDLAEIALYIAEFREPHDDDANARESWKNLSHFLDAAERWSALV